MTYFLLTNKYKYKYFLFYNIYIKIYFFLIYNKVFNIGTKYYLWYNCFSFIIGIWNSIIPIIFMVEDR
jgi:hypothetical protein